MYQENIEQNAYRGANVSSESQDLAIRLNTLCRVYEQTDRVLTQDPITVHVVQNGPAPAWSDGRDIYINKDQITEFDLDELIQINGLNYHELAHHLYSPRKGTTIMQWVMENDARYGNYIQSINILEDQRIETLLVARYPAIVPYLTKTTVRWLADSPETMSTNYIAVRGRQYLPLELRIAFRDMFIMPELIPVAAEIIDAYRVLHFPKQYKEAQELIQRFKEEVLDKLFQATGGVGTNGGPSVCGHRQPVALGRPDPGKAQQRDSDRAKQMGNPEPIFVHKPEQVNSEQSDEVTVNRAGPDSDSNSGNGNDKNFSDGHGETTNFVAPKTVEEALDARNTERPHSVSSSVSGHAQSLGGIPDNVSEIFESINTSISSNKNVIADVKAKQRVIVGGDDKQHDAVPNGKYSTVPVPSDVIVSARRFGRELERLKQECEPIWQREMPAGRLNVQRIIKGCEINEAFDRWAEGTDGTNIEAVMLIDRSGSMSSGNNDMRASEAAYVIKRAMEHIDAKVTIYSFDNQAELVSSRDTKVDKTSMPFIYGNGGTNPESSLIVSERLFKTSKAKTKILFLVTDGQFQHRTNDEIINRLNSMGVITVMVLIADKDQAEYLENYYKNRSEHSSSENLQHNCSIYGLINTAEDLLPFAKEVVTSTIKQSLRG